MLDVVLIVSSETASDRTKRQNTERWKRHLVKPLESLLHSFVELHPEDAARSIESLDADEAGRLFRTLPEPIAARLAERLNPNVVAPIFERLEPDHALRLLGALAPRPASAIVHHLVDDVREMMLQQLPTETAKQLRELFAYPAETAGAMMEPRVVSFPIDLTVEQATAAIRKARRDALHYLYVTKRDGSLAGVLNMRDLLLGEPDAKIEPMVHRNVLTISETMPSDEVVALMRDRKFLALPVVDLDGHLLGVVKHNEALETGQLEAFEDLQKMVGVGGDERALSPVSTVVKRRLPWLIVNLVTAFMAASVVAIFEDTIAKIAALAVLLPIVSGQGGNSGAQSLAIVMRGLALREIFSGTRRRVVIKEVTAGLFNGIAVAAVTAGAVYCWKWNVGLALVIFLAMIVNMVAAALAGAVIPMVLKALGRDPAQSASIFLTTVTDIVGFASFLGFAVLFMDMLIPLMAAN
ncbi:MAG: magnesium transporter [Planctomycetaceae bacterium]|jgi:magnesium transporter